MSERRVRSGSSRARAAPAAEPLTPPAPSDGEVYLYGFVRWPVPAQLSRALGTGVGEPPRPVRLARSGDLAALVSDVAADELSDRGVRGMRRDMKAHSLLLNSLATKTTVLPVRFGVVLKDERSLIERVLAPRRATLSQYLNQLEGAAEVTLRVSYVEPQILREVVAENPELAGASKRRGLSASPESQIELGRRVALAIQEVREVDARQLLKHLEAASKDVRVSQPLSDLMVLNAAFLVDRSRLDRFDRTLEELSKEAGGRMTFDCVGPLPPFSFAELRL
jgi:hypothetical protein